MLSDEKACNNNVDVYVIVCCTISYLHKQFLLMFTSIITNKGVNSLWYSFLFIASCVLIHFSTAVNLCSGYCDHFDSKRPQCKPDLSDT